MKNDDKFYPGFNDENLNRDKKLKDDLGEESEARDLRYDADEDSYEIDIASKDPDYDPPALFDSSAPNGSDMDSTYDEANPYDVKGEYDKDRSLATDADSLGMHITDEEITEVDPVDRALSRTPEDDRDDLDEEGYPKNDREISKEDEDDEFLK